MAELGRFDPGHLHAEEVVDGDVDPEFLASGQAQAPDGFRSVPGVREEQAEVRVTADGLKGAPRSEGFLHEREKLADQGIPLAFQQIRSALGQPELVPALQEVRSGWCYYF